MEKQAIIGRRHESYRKRKQATREKKVVNL